MAEVTYNSLQYLTDEDATAMAVYLKSLAPRDAPPAVSDTERPQPAVLEMGRKIYVQQCVMCHGNEGKASRRPIRRSRRTVHHDGDAGQPDTHGPEWRLSTGDAQGQGRTACRRSCTS